MNSQGQFLIYYLRFKYSFLMRLGVLSLFWLCRTVALADPGQNAYVETEGLIDLSTDSNRYVNIQSPNHFRTPEINALDNTPANNPTTDAGATLGRVLFYDKKLSSDNTVSCATCHQQRYGFSNVLRAGTGVGGKQTRFKTPALANVRYRTRFHLGSVGALSVASLEQQSLIAITRDDEMGNSNISEVVEELQGVEYYPSLFKQAFGDELVSEQRIAKALSQFMRSMLSFNSKFDRGVPTNFANFSAKEKLGLELFNSDRTGCSQCHSTHLQRLADGKGSNGLGYFPEGIRASLRNVAERRFFMRFGSKETLSDVIDHYNIDIPSCNGSQYADDVICLTVEHPLQGPELGTYLRPSLSAEEKAALISFLETLSDPLDYSELGLDESVAADGYYSLLLDPRFSDPFIQTKSE